MNTTKKTFAKIIPPVTAAEAKLQRLIKQDQAEKARFKHINISFRENRFGPLLFGMLFAGIGTFLIFQSSASTQPASGVKPANSTQTVSMWLTPNGMTVVDNTLLTTEIWLDSKGEKIQAVQADLVYPPDKLQFVNVDAEAGDFSAVNAQSSGGNGVVRVARGSDQPLSGKRLVARVTFKVIAASGRATVGMVGSSQVLRAGDSVNVLAMRTDAQYRLSN